MTAALTQPTGEPALRTIPPGERHLLIFGRFDALATGQSLQLVNHHHPQPLRHPFDDRAFGQAEWAALEAGPEARRIEITRIAQPAATSAGAKGDACCSGGACRG